jgi:hypothetical protein
VRTTAAPETRLLPRPQIIATRSELRAFSTQVSEGYAAVGISLLISDGPPGLVSCRLGTRCHDYSSLLPAGSWAVDDGNRELIPLFDARYVRDALQRVRSMGRQAVPHGSRMHWLRRSRTRLRQRTHVGDQGNVYAPWNVLSVTHNSTILRFSAVDPVLLRPSKRKQAIVGTTRLTPKA